MEKPKLWQVGAQQKWAEEWEISFPILPILCWALQPAQSYRLAALAAMCGTRRPRELIIKQKGVIGPLATAVPPIIMLRGGKMIVCNKNKETFSGWAAFLLLESLSHFASLELEE